jgi:acyl carrier protein
VKPTREEIQAYVLATLQELCRDWDYSRPVGPESLLFTELGLESLDAVVLGTIIQEHFQRPLPFAELLAEIGREERDLSIMELVAFVDQHLNHIPLEAGPAGRVQ